MSNNIENKCWKCANITIEATLGIPYFLCEEKMDMDAEVCTKYRPDTADEHERAYDHA